MIAGDTQLLFMLGHPVAQTKSPALMNAWFAENQLPIALIPLDLHPRALAGFMEAIKSAPNVWGCILTIPHKGAAARHVDELSGISSCLGAVNVMRRTKAGRWAGDMLDGQAVVNALEEIDVRIQGRRVSVIGCGGAGSAAAYSIAAAGAKMLSLQDCDAQKPVVLSERLSSIFSECDILTGPTDLAAFDIVIHASPLGMRASDPLPFTPAELSPGAVVVDAVTAHSITPLIGACEAKGLRVITGNTLARVQQPLMLRYLIDNALEEHLANRSARATR